jgi:glycosyltransferase involved in cell wall biosynthesis
MTRVVAHFIDTRAFGGAERALLHLLTAMDRQVWRPVLLHHDEPGLRPLIERVDAAEIDRRIVASMRGPGEIAAMPAFVRALRTTCAEILHAHLNWPLGCSGGILAAKLAGVPSVATVHLFSEGPRAVSIPLQRLILPRVVGRYIAVSDAVAGDIEQHLHVPRRRICVVRNGIPVEAEVPEVRESGNGRATVVTLARLDLQKGLTHLLHAAVLLPDVDFVIAGDGPERANLEAEARALGVADRIAFVGFQADTRAFLARGDVFVLPSLLEGLPLAVLEALAAARPVVATAVGGTPEVVRDRETGLLVPPADSRALADAIRELLGNPALADQLGRQGRDLVRREFSSAATARAVIRIYDDLLGVGPGVQRP